MGCERWFIFFFPYKVNFSLYADFISVNSDLSVHKPRSSEPTENTKEGLWDLSVGKRTYSIYEVVVTPDISHVIFLL